MVRSKKGDKAQPQRAVIFDFDGTIADSLPAAIQVFGEMTGHDVAFSPEQVNAYRDLSVPELIRALKIPAWKVPKLIIQGRKLLRRHLNDIPQHKGVMDVIMALHTQGVPLYVLSSNSTENVHSYLRQHNMQQYFYGAYGGASLLGKAPRLIKLIENENIDVTFLTYSNNNCFQVSGTWI